MSREVAIIGIGLSEWGELWQKSYRDIFTAAALNAIDDAGVDHIDALYLGSMSGGLFNGQEHIASLMTDYLGVNPIPATRVESACASGSLALKTAYMDVALGLHDIVLVGGVEKMTDVDGDQATYALASAADQEYEVYQGITFPGLYAMIARLHMEKYRTTRRQLSEVAVKNHYHGSMNPNAQYPQQITAEAVENSVMIADPLRILDCSPITDGAAALIICPLSLANKFKKHTTVKIKGFGHATDTIALHNRKDMSWLYATEEAARQAYKMADTGPPSIQVAEVHDCFTMAEICVLEALGLADKGEGGQMTEAGKTRIDGKLPINTSGGLKSKGHPVGATGVAQIVELTLQLRGEAGNRQAQNVHIALAQNMGGSGGSTLVHILEGS